jgi:hypothetical protein
MANDKKLNNLLDMKDFSEKDVVKKAKTTKRTDVAKDVLQENAYVIGKDVLGDKLKNKEFHAAKGLNNLISLSDYSDKVEKDASAKKHSKRTETGKDIINEKKSSAKQKAARSKFMDMINKKKSKKEDKSCD